jgi:two-component system, NarL family, nitrate/nitrite response regulator NarL
LGAVDHAAVGAPGAPGGSGTDPIRILVVADIRLYREGLAEVFGRAGRLHVVAAVARPLDAVGVLDDETVDIVLLGLESAHSVTAAQTIVGAHPEARLVALAVDERPEDVVPLAEVGICGYVNRDAALPDLVATVESVARGELPCSPSVAAGLVRRLAALAARVGGPAPPACLTAREQEVLHLLGEGLSNKEIGRRLCIELPTVKNHVHHVLEKLHVRRRAEAVAVVRRAGWS